MFDVNELFSKRNQRDAMKHFMNAKDGICADGLSVSKLEEFWTLNRERIIAEVQKCIYEPGIIKNTEIINCGVFTL